MLWSELRLILKTSSVTPDCFYVFYLILSFSTVSQSFKKICVWKFLGANVLKVPIIPKYFSCLNESLHQFETHCVVKVTKSSHHLSHDRASKGHASIPCVMSETDLHRIKSL